MKRYIIRLDDASNYMDIQEWVRMEKLLDQYGIKPIFGIIPKNGDESLISNYEQNDDFWNLVHSWIDKGWTPAMHGYEHKYVTQNGGINPVNKRSEFAGLPYEEQAAKIKSGYQILADHEIYPDIFFAPSHTFDENTLKAIYEETPIRIISDTVAWDIYRDGAFWYIPQQSGRVRKLPFGTVTFCYHPNTMNINAFEELECFFIKYSKCFVSVQDISLLNKEKSVLDQILQKGYFFFRRH